jgi:hypothetical protein
MDGKPDLCASSISDASVEALEYCREEASLAAALRSGNPKTCAASPLCNALSSRQVQACTPYLVEANKLFCAAVSKQMEVAAALAKKQAAERQAALVRAAAELVQQRRIEEEQKRRAEALRKNTPPKQTFRHGQRMQTIPLAVKKRMEEIEKQSKAARLKAPGVPAPGTSPQ